MSWNRYGKKNPFGAVSTEWYTANMYGSILFPYKIKSNFTANNVLSNDRCYYRIFVV